MAHLHHLIYQSTVVMAFSQAELGRLLHQSGPRNIAAGITGILLYDGSRFLQVLEGPPAGVAETFARIRVDCRHTEVQVLADGPVARRQFADWQMRLVTYIDYPALGGEHEMPTALTITDAALCMLLHDFQQHALKRNCNQLQ